MDLDHTVINNMSDGSEIENSNFLEGDLADVQAQVRYCIYHQINWYSDKKYDKYWEILNEWMKLKHPRINSISGVSFSKDDASYDGIKSHLAVTIISNSEIYVAHMNAYYADDLFN